MRDFRGKGAVVTGGASGIGRALLHALADEGMNLVVADVEMEPAQKVADELSAKGVQAHAFQCDVRDPDSVQALADRAHGLLGGVELLVNNAGVLTMGPFSEKIHADWRWLMSVNADGVANGVFAFLPRMLQASGERHIVNTASVAGLYPYPQLSIYAASKYAVVGLSECLRAELEPQGIGVSVICPGGVATNIMGAARNRPAEFGGPIKPESAPSDMQGAMSPAEAAARIVAGIRANELYILTHPETRTDVASRFDGIMDAYSRQS